MRVIITIDTDNAAFQQSAHHEGLETARILGKLALLIGETGIPVGGATIRDINGNKVGELATEETAASVPGIERVDGDTCPGCGVWANIPCRCQEGS